MSHFHRKISRKSALECEGVKLPFRREISNIFFLFFGDLSVFLGQKKQSEDLFDYFKYMKVNVFGNVSKDSHFLGLQNSLNFHRFANATNTNSQVPLMHHHLLVSDYFEISNIQKSTQLMTLPKNF